MTDPDIASFGEPNRSRPEGYRLTHPRNETASESSMALTGFDPGRGSLGRPEVTVAWTPADIAPEWAIGAPAPAEPAPGVPVAGPDQPYGRSESFNSAPDSVAIPRQSGFSAFTSHGDTEPEYPATGFNAPGPGAAPPTTAFGAAAPTAVPGGTANSAFRIDPPPPQSPPELPRRAPGLPQRTPNFGLTTTESGSLFDEPSVESESESGQHSNGSAFTSAESGHHSNGSAPSSTEFSALINESAFTAPTSGPATASPENPDIGRAAYLRTPQPDVHATESLPGATESGAHEAIDPATQPQPIIEPAPAAVRTIAATPAPENTSRTGQLTGSAEPTPPTVSGPTPPWIRTTGSAHSSADSARDSTESDTPATEFDSHETESTDTPAESSRAPLGRNARDFARRTGHSASDSPGLRPTGAARHADTAATAETSRTGVAALSAPSPDSRPAGPASRRTSTHRRAAPQDDTPTSVDVHLVMQLLLSSHTLESVADKAEAGEASLEDFIRAARRTRTATVDLVSAWFGGTTQMRQFAEALLAASDST